MFARPLGCCLALTALLSGQAPAGFRTYENKLAPVTFFYPTSYQEMPVPPTEQVVVAKYVQKDKSLDLKDVSDKLYKWGQPEILVFRFDLAAVTTGPKPAEPEQPAGPGTVREAMEASTRVTSWSEFVKRFERWNLVEHSKKADHFEMQWKDELQQWPSGQPKPIGYLVRRQEGNTILGVYGQTFSPAKKTFESHLQRMAGSLALAAEDAGELAGAAIDFAT